MGSALVGCLLGAILSGSLSDRFGRKRLLILAALVFVVSSLGTALVDSFVAFNVWRIAGGVAIGLASNLSPMYIAEIAPAAVRGRLVAMNQFTIVTGILLAQVANFGVDYFDKGADRQSLAAAAAPAAGWDAGRVAEELSWQLKRGQRPAFIEQFKQLAAKRSASLEHTGGGRDPQGDQQAAGESRRSTPATNSRWKWWAAAWTPTTCCTAGGGCSA